SMTKWPITNFDRSSFVIRHSSFVDRRALLAVNRSGGKLAGTDIDAEAHVAGLESQHGDLELGGLARPNRHRVVNCLLKFLVGVGWPWGADDVHLLGSRGDDDHVGRRPRPLIGDRPRVAHLLARLNGVIGLIDVDRKASGALKAGAAFGAGGKAAVRGSGGL